MSTPTVDPDDMDFEALPFVESEVHDDDDDQHEVSDD
jgi:hypothetical protein